MAQGDGVRWHSRSSKSLRLPFPSGPLSYEDRPSLPSPANCPVRGSRRHPPRGTAASFPPAGLDWLLCCPSSLPHVRCWSVSTVSCHRERVERAVLTVRKGVLTIVQAPFPGRLAPASGDSPQTTHLLGKSVENGSVLGSECVCQGTAPQASIPWLS